MLQILMITTTIVLLFLIKLININIESKKNQIILDREQHTINILTYGTCYAEKLAKNAAKNGSVLTSGTKLEIAMVYIFKELKRFNIKLTETEVKQKIDVVLGNGLNEFSNFTGETDEYEDDEDDDAYYDRK